MGDIRWHLTDLTYLDACIHVGFLSYGYTFTDEDGFRAAGQSNSSLWPIGGPRPPSTANCTCVLFFNVVICIPQTRVIIYFVFMLITTKVTILNC